MKKCNKVATLALAGTMLFSTVLGTGCKKEESFGDKTVLRVGLYEGGWGSEWLDKVIENFETDYPEYKVLYEGDKTKYKDNQLLQGIESGRQDLFIAPIFLYDALSQNKLMEVTDLMTTPLNQLVKTTDTATIQSKMWAELDEFFTSYKGEGKYYSAPLGGGVYPINYDRDLFNDEYLFIKAGTSADNGGKITWVNESGTDEKGNAGKLSVGQDGLENTADDGLPVSYADFKALLTEMKRRTITPFIWSKQNGYGWNFLNSLIAHYEGKDNFNLFKTMDGSYTFEGDTEPTTITSQNAYRLQEMTGKKWALQFAYDIATDGTNYHDDSGRETCDFLDAQNIYLDSVAAAKEGRGQRIAFLIDGAHWQNEAKSTMEEMAGESDDYKNRRFGIMPFPKFPGTTATKATYFSSSFSGQVFIRKNPEQPEAAKLFYAYLHTDESLRICTQYSGMIRPLNYTMPKETLNNMSYYYQSLWNTFKDADIVHNVSTNPYIYQNEYFFTDNWLFRGVTPSGLELVNPFEDFKSGSLTVEDYRQGMISIFTPEYWQKEVLTIE